MTVDLRSARNVQGCDRQDQWLKTDVYALLRSKITPTCPVRKGSKPEEIRDRMELMSPCCEDVFFGVRNPVEAKKGSGLALSQKEIEDLINW